MERNNNYLYLIFIKLFIKSNHSTLNSINLLSKLVLKSFYKNQDHNSTNVLNDINTKLSYKFNYFIGKFLFTSKFIGYYYLRESNINKFSNYVFFNNIKSNYKLKYIRINSKPLIWKNQYFFLNFLYFLFNFYFIFFLNSLVLKLNFKQILKVSKLPTKISKFTLLRSPHIDKKSREQFEIRRHKSNISCLNLFSYLLPKIISSKDNHSYIEYII